MNGFRVPESPQIHNILKKINALRSPYLGNAVSGSKMESPRMLQFAKGGIRSGNSYKQFESGSPTNEHGMLNYFPSSHYSGFVPAYPVHAFEDSGYQGSQQAMRAALFEREQLHSRYPYRPIRDPSMMAELHGHYSLLQKPLKPSYSLPSQQFAAQHLRPRPIKELADSDPYMMPMFLRSSYDRGIGISPSQRNIFSESLMRKRQYESQLRAQDYLQRRRPVLLPEDIDETLAKI